MERVIILFRKKHQFLSLIILYLSLIMVAFQVWLHRDFGRVTFEQLFFYVKMPMGELPFSLIYRTIGIIFGIPTFIIVAVIIILHFCKKRNFFSRNFYFAGTCIILLSLVYSFFSYDFMSYYKAQLSGLRSNSSFYEKYYVEPKRVLVKESGKTNNLIIISLESIENTYSDPNLFEKDYILPLSEVKAANQSFRFEAVKNTNHTIASLVGIQTGIPLQSPPIGSKDSYEKLPVFLPNAYSLGQILETKGYSTFYISGSSVEFSGTDVFMKSHGFKETTFGVKELAKNGWLKNYPVDLSGNSWKWWGVADSKIYELLKKEIARLALQEKPFYAMMSTMDTHGYDGYRDERVSDGITKNPFGDIVYFSAQQAADFVKWVKEQPFGENTTIIIIGDHLAMNNPVISQLTKGDRTIFNTIINSKRKAPENNRKISHFDLFPTALESIGFQIEGGKLALGVSIYSDQPTLIEILGNQELGEMANQKNEIYRSFLLPSE